MQTRGPDAWQLHPEQEAETCVRVEGLYGVVSCGGESTEDLGLRLGSTLPWKCMSTPKNRRVETTCSLPEGHLETGEQDEGELSAHVWGCRPGAVASRPPRGMCMPAPRFQAWASGGREERSKKPCVLGNACVWKLTIEGTNRDKQCLCHCGACLPSHRTEYKY